MRLSATVPLLALGSASLFAVGLTATAVPDASSSCSHARPGVSSVESKRLSQPTSSKDPRPLGETLGEGIDLAVRSLEPLDATGRPESGLPYGLSQGVIGVVGSASTGYKVVVDESVVEEQKYQAAVARHVPAAGKQLVGIEPSCRSAEAIAEAWNAVGARSWSADARRTTFAADLDPETEDIVVEYDEATTSPPVLEWPAPTVRRTSRRQLLGADIAPERHPERRPLGRRPDHLRLEELHRGFLRRTAIRRPARVRDRRPLRWRGDAVEVGHQLLRHHHGPDELPRLRPVPAHR